MPKNYSVTWTPPASDGGSPITGHDVGYTPAGGSETVEATGSAAASHIITGLTDGTEYSVRVRAENGEGKGPWSSAVTQVAALAPSQVTGLAADSTGDGTIDLSWTAPASDASIADYSVEYTPSGGSATTVLVGSATTSYQITGLTNDTEYSVRVAAVSAAGTGAYSAAVTGTPSAAPTDPDFANVSLLMHFDSDFSDSSSNSFTPTNNGVVISSAQSKFGGSSAYFDGNSRYFNFNNQSAFVFGTGDFVIEFFVYLSSITDANIYESRFAGTGAFANKAIIGIYQGNLYYGATGYISGPPMSAGQWYYLAVARDSGSTRMYVDGVQVGSTYADTNDYNNDSTAPVVGMFPPNSNTTLNGYIDELRITKGSSRGYTGSTITVPTAAFPDA